MCQYARISVQLRVLTLIALCRWGLQLFLAIGSTWNDETLRNAPNQFPNFRLLPASIYGFENPVGFLQLSRTRHEAVRLA